MNFARIAAKVKLNLLINELSVFVAIISFFVYHEFQFYATIGGFASGKNCVSAAVNHTIYGASTKLLLSVLQTCKGFCVFKIYIGRRPQHMLRKMFSLLHS